MVAFTNSSRRRRRQIYGRKKPESAIPTTGMADIAFLLIIFFVVTTVYSQDRTSVNLPNSTVRSAAEADAAIVVLARDKQGSGALVYKFSDGKSPSVVVSGLDAIRAEAASVVSVAPERTFQIKADGGIPWDYVGAVFDTLNSAGVSRIVMLTDAVEPDSGEDVP